MNFTALATATLIATLSSCTSTHKRIVQLDKPQCCFMEGKDDKTVTSRYVEYDTDNDGEADYIALMNEKGVKYKFLRQNPNGSLESIIEQSQLNDPKINNVVLCLDGVSFDTMKDLYKRGYFRLFNKPGRLISTFPSISYYAFGKMFGLHKPEGYEEEAYFDREKNKIIGGNILKEIFNIHYHEKWLYMPKDNKLSLTTYLLSYIVPAVAADFELSEARKTITESDRKNTIIYVLTTDTYSHLYKKNDVEDLLIRIDSMIEDIFFKKNGRIKFIIVSDHGSNLTPSDKRINLESAIRKSGFNNSDSLRAKNDVVIPKFGMVNYASIFTDPVNVKKIVNIVKGVNGVDLVFYHENSAVVVESKNGRALIEGNQGKFRYTAVLNDPLELKEVLEKLKANKKLDENLYADDSDWMEFTRDKKYPDSLKRIYDGLGNEVMNVPNILISIKNGYYYSDVFLDSLSTSKGTHGSLEKESTYGIFMSNFFEVPRHIRIDAVMEYINKYHSIELKPIQP